MDENLEQDEKHVSSVEIINISGISRATLNNYIKMGILPRPLVKRPEDYTISRAKQMGFFPRSVLNTLDKIRQYKKDGCRMVEICKLLTEKPILSSEGSQNGEATKDTGRILFERPVSDYRNESEELFSHDEIYTGYHSGESDMKNEIRATLRQGTVNLFHFSVLVAEIQGTAKICAELPPYEYICLIKQIFKSMAFIFKKYFGVYGKHPGTGIVFYFLKDRDSSYLMNAVICALELREMMKKFSHEWKNKKEFFDDLYLNIGISDGHEFLGTVPAAPAVEHVSLGDSINSARRLSELAYSGAIWTTKKLLILLDEKERRHIHYGIYRRIQDREVLVEKIFSRVKDLFPPDDPRYSKYMDIWSLPVTEIQTLR